MRFSNAITRKPGPDFSGGITTAGLGSPDFEKAVVQHSGYCTALSALGLDVTVLDPLEGFPDCSFVEDTAVITPGLAVVTRPGHPRRRGEESAMGAILGEYRQVEYITAPGTLDGGDVMMANSNCFIGISERTNRAGASQLDEILSRAGYRCTIIPSIGGLHLKSSVNYIADGTIVLLEEIARMREFASFNKVTVPKTEAYAANCLWINDTVLVPEGFPETRNRIEAAGFCTACIDVSEFRKMDGGLTCLSLRF